MKFFLARQLFRVVSKAAIAWTQTTEKDGQSTTTFSITERKTSIPILLWYEKRQRELLPVFLLYSFQEKR